jgi:beta-N-acetylhexosaminidase
MMAAHVVLRALDPVAPASLSPRVGVRLLRGEFGFGGAYVTDCLEMGAISSEGKTIDASVVALGAGADLLLFSHQPELAAQSATAIERAVESGSMPRARLEEAYERVVALRRAGQAPLPLGAFAPHPGVGREIARRAVTVIRGIAHADPTASFVLDFGGGGATLSREAPACEAFVLPLDPRPADVTQALALLEKSRRRPIVLSRRAHQQPAQAGAIAAVVDRFPDALVISMLEPYDLRCFGDARHVLAAYGDDAASIGGLADVIFGGLMAQGRLPVEYAIAVG